jgi:hypothetical protein
MKPMAVFGIIFAAPGMTLTSKAESSIHPSLTFAILTA